MPKKIAVVAANGKEGRLVVEEAQDRGMDVTAFVRSANKTKAKTAVQKDIMDLTTEDLAGFDAVVDAFGAWTPETLPQHSTTLAHLCDILTGSDTRLIIVGGAGSLEELKLNDRGESIISYADYAIALVDEIENGNHIQQRISVVRK